MHNYRLVYLILVLVSCEALAQVQLGKTYAITEEDALNEINSKAKTFQGLEDIDLKKTTAFNGYPLPDNTAKNDRIVAPFYTLDIDITALNGNVIYPKGFTYNVAEYVTLPFRVVVFSESQIEFIKPMLEPTDILLLSEGDIFKVKKELEQDIFYLDTRIAERLYVDGVPSIITQVGVQYRISELYVAE